MENSTNNITEQTNPLVALIQRCGVHEVKRYDSRAFYQAISLGILTQDQIRSAQEVYRSSRNIMY